ncbi:hypothetical protein Cni_G29392 [Canna indica]|uniref:DOG1 domain-containing protein n=1 Tax=Canna indica TaxID=4628 RepID=A0AAQ3L771_9LILI|nr:hypothetical protein Cni_G29392 [Canna indica]
MDGRFLACYEEWLRIQGADLNELLQAVPTQNGNSDLSEGQLRQLVDKNMRHYEDYYELRRRLVRNDGPAFFSPSWCNSFENSVLWIGGCRPSMFIRLIYSLSSADLEAHLDSLVAGSSMVAAAVASASHGGGAGLVGLSSSQLAFVNDLHKATLKDEERITSQMATLQESVADRPLIPIVKERQQQRSRSGASSCGVNGDSGDQEVEAAMQEYAEAIASMVEEADRLRVETARRLLSEILTPKQAVELLATAKQLHLSVHEWGGQRDLKQGRCRGC